MLFLHSPANSQVLLIIRILFVELKETVNAAKLSLDGFCHSAAVAVLRKSVITTHGPRFQGGQAVRSCYLLTFFILKWEDNRIVEMALGLESTDFLQALGHQALDGFRLIDFARRAFFVKDIRIPLAVVLKRRV